MGDSVGAHGSSFWAGVGLVAGLAVGAALGAAVIILTGGLAAPAVVGALFMASAVVGGVALAAAGASAGEKLGESFDHDHDDSGKSSGTPCSSVKKGFDTCLIEKQPAARMTDAVNHSDAELKEGSGTVYIGGRCASRKDDKSTCTGKVITFAKHTFIGGPKASSGAPDQETTAGFLHDLGNAFGSVAKWAGLASLGLAGAAVGAAAAVGATGLAVASGVGIAVSFGLSKLGHMAGAGVGSMIDSAMGYTDHRFEQFSGTAAAMGAGFLTGTTMAAGERAMGFFGRAPGEVDVLPQEPAPQLTGPAAREPMTIDMVQGPDGVYRMADGPVAEPAGPRALEGPAGEQRLLPAPNEPAAVPAEDVPAAPEAAPADAAPSPPAARPTAEEIMARSDQLYRANDEAFDELFDDSYPEGRNPDLAYSVISRDALPGVMENGLLAGRAFGKQGENANNIWFSEGAPFYRDGIVLSIPKSRLLELGGEPGVGLHGQSNVIRVPHDKAPNGIPFDEFAVGEVVGKGYVAEIYRPPGWKGDVGPQLPTVPKPFEGLIKGIDEVQGGGARGGGGGGNGELDLALSAEEAACTTCASAERVQQAVEWANAKLASLPKEGHMSRAREMEEFAAGRISREDHAKHELEFDGMDAFVKSPAGQKAGLDESSTPDEIIEAAHEHLMDLNKANQQEVFNGREHPSGVSAERLDAAVNGLDGERVPLTYKGPGGINDIAGSVDQMHDFQQGLSNIAETNGITDMRIVQVGSGTTGWKNNPMKLLQHYGKGGDDASWFTDGAWKPSSDTDLAVFSDQAKVGAMEIDNPINADYGIFKTGSPGGKAGFSNTPLGKDLYDYGKLWDQKVYDQPALDANPDGLFDFKLNISDDAFTTPPMMYRGPS